MWVAELGFAAVEAVTKDKKPVTTPFLRGTEYRPPVSWTWGKLPDFGRRIVAAS